ncbi:hypothetical protein ACV3OO_12275 [Clostridium perfringens]
MSKRMFLDNFDNKEGYLYFGTHVFSIELRQLIHIDHAIALELRNKYPFLTNIQIAKIINNQNKLASNS